MSWWWNTLLIFLFIANIHENKIISLRFAFLYEVVGISNHTLYFSILMEAEILFAKLDEMLVVIDTRQGVNPFTHLRF